MVHRWSVMWLLLLINANFRFVRAALQPSTINNPTLPGNARHSANYHFSILSKLNSKDENSRVEEFGRERNAQWRERSKRWIVIVDDEEPIRRAVGQFLFDQGYQVTACADAKNAFAVAKSRRVADGQLRELSDNSETPTFPDVIVTDIRMPGMDGLEFLRKLRADKQLVGIPVILLTAKGMTQDRIEGYKAGADAYLPKPFDPEELLTLIDKSIERRDAVNGNKVGIDDLQRDLNEIKYMLLEKGGGGIGNGWVEQTNVFLTPDERGVLEQLCKGFTNKEIAEKTYLSTRRVEQLLTSMFRKTNLKNRTELVRWAVRTGNVVL